MTFITKRLSVNFRLLFGHLLCFLYYIAAKATYIRLLHGKVGFLGGFFGPSSVKRGRTHIVLR